MFQQLTYFQMITLTFIFLINVYSFGLFYIDKQRARRSKYRVSEKKLLLSAFLMGGLGAWVGMTKFRHKTQKTSFKIGVPAAALLTLTVISLILFYNAGM